MDVKELNERKEKLVAANLQREQLVGQLNEQILAIQNQIVLEKEAHDFTRGQIELIEQLMQEGIDSDYSPTNDTKKKK